MAAPDPGAVWTEVLSAAEAIKDERARAKKLAQPRGFRAKSPPCQLPPPLERVNSERARAECCPFG